MLEAMSFSRSCAKLLQLLPVPSGSSLARHDAAASNPPSRVERQCPLWVSVRLEPIQTQLSI